MEMEQCAIDGHLRDMYAAVVIIAKAPQLHGAESMLVEIELHDTIADHELRGEDCSGFVTHTMNFFAPEMARGTKLQKTSWSAIHSPGLLLMRCGIDDIGCELLVRGLGVSGHIIPPSAFCFCFFTCWMHLYC